MGATEKSFNAIDGVPLYYWRHNPPNKKRYTVKSTNELYNQLVRFKRDLHNYTSPAGYGNIAGIVTAGAYVNKGGQHGAGKAFDIDQILWTSGRACTPYRQVHNYPKAWGRLRYYALDAVCRQHFRYVLDANFDARHEDHFHIDTSGLPVRLGKTTSSDVKFIQAVCNEFAGQTLRIDGKWGPKTGQAFTTTLNKAGLSSLNPLSSVTDYRKFLQKVSQHGFRAKTFN